MAKLTICSRCNEQPRRKNDSWCLACRATYNRERRRNIKLGKWVSSWPTPEPRPEPKRLRTPTLKDLDTWRSEKGNQL